MFDIIGESAERLCDAEVSVVTRLDGEWSIPDIEAHSPERVPETLYSVRFTAEELWGDVQSGVSVNVDLWDSYLEPV